MVALGGNLDRRRLRFVTAWNLLRLVLREPVRSSLWLSPPAGFPDQPPFWNAAVAGGWSGSGPDLMARLRQAEQALGRVERFRNGPREIDLDLVLLGESVSSDPGCLLPHPRFLERPFVLVPAAEVAPDVAPPGGPTPLSSLASRCDASDLVRLAPPSGWERVAEPAGPLVS